MEAGSATQGGWARQEAVARVSGRPVRLLRPRRPVRRPLLSRLALFGRCLRRRRPRWRGRLATRRLSTPTGSSANILAAIGPCRRENGVESDNSAFVPKAKRDVCLADACAQQSGGQAHRRHSDMFARFPELVLFPYFQPSRTFRAEDAMECDSKIRLRAPCRQGCFSLKFVQGYLVSQRVWPWMATFERFPGNTHAPTPWPCALPSGAHPNTREFSSV